MQHVSVREARRIPSRALGQRRQPRGSLIRLGLPAADGKLPASEAAVILLKSGCKCGSMRIIWSG